VYLHIDTFEPPLTSDETHAAWLRAEARAGARLRRHERRRGRFVRLLAAVIG
jgi:hypothetical protein